MNIHPLRPMITIALAGLVSCRPSEQREQRDFERMRQQQRYDAYEFSSFFPNGSVMQAPPANTVPRDETPGLPGPRPAAYFTGSAGGADVADVPIPMNEAALARGAAQFEISCVPCHGAGGYGGGLMAANLSAKRPPSLRIPPVSTLSAGTLFKVITDGFGQMPPYGWQMTADERWSVVAYVRTLENQPSNPEMRADSATADYLRHLDSARAAGKPLPPATAAVASRQP